MTETKICSKCKKEYPIDKFYHNHSKKLGIRNECVLCSKKDNDKRYYEKYKNDPEYKAGRKAYAHEWHLRNAIKRHQEMSDNAKRQRLLCIEHYGGKCDCCGEKRYEFLAIDHINGGGGKHRKQIGNHTVAWLVRNNFPDGFRILCHNCNQSLGHYGYCPHKKPQKIKAPLVSYTLFPSSNG